MADKVESVQEHDPPLSSDAMQLVPPSVDAIWKGENDSDGEYSEEMGHPLE